ncbi:MAG: nucleotidyltransferase family protein [Methylothermaceae bacterium]|nr:nucleotidyltransferase family protein [Methylothermaceae bacterium]
MPERERGIAGLVLAAGASSRLGRPKQLLTLDGVPLVRRTVLNALESLCDRVFVVVGAHRNLIMEAISDLDVAPVYNRAWREGMGGSVRVGIARMGNYRAVLIILTDQIRVGVAHLDRLIEAFERYGEIAASKYADTLGVPALFPRRYFDDLQRLSGDSGAKFLLERYARRVIRIPCPEAIVDIDDAYDLQKSGCDDGIIYVPKD